MEVILEAYVYHTDSEVVGKILYTPSLGSSTTVLGVRQALPETDQTDPFMWEMVTADVVRMIQKKLGELP